MQALFNHPRPLFDPGLGLSCPYTAYSVELPNHITPLESLQGGPGALGGHPRKASTAFLRPLVSEPGSPTTLSQHSIVPTLNIPCLHRIASQRTPSGGPFPFPPQKSPGVQCRPHLSDQPPCLRCPTTVGLPTYYLPTYPPGPLCPPFSRPCPPPNHHLACLQVASTSGMYPGTLASRPHSPSVSRTSCATYIHYRHTHCLSVAPPPPLPLPLSPHTTTI